MEAENKIYKKGTFGERLTAFIIDELILFLITIILSQILSKQAYGYISLLINSIVYGSFFLWKYGQTPGKKIMKLKVVDINYQPIGFGTALLRESIGKFLSSITFELGYFWVLINSKRQAWHDKLAKTYVVKTDNMGQLISLEQEEKETTGQKIIFGILFLISTLPITFFIFLIIVYLLIAQPFQIKGQTMTPNYVDGQYYFASKIAYNKNDPVRGDVIVFKSPTDPQFNYFKRIIGIPGDTILVQNGKVYLNGSILNESVYLNNDIKTLGSSFLREGTQIIVPEDKYFVLGDNRKHSSDSRDWGFVSKQDIIGKITFCYWNCSSR